MMSITRHIHLKAKSCQKFTSKRLKCHITDKKNQTFVLLYHLIYCKHYEKSDKILGNPHILSLICCLLNKFNNI